ncbi:MAG: UDP-2,3-diacylglucosamine diphosphatase LpxG [Chlamydiales bacterium]|nr:UDP-2,3-diacylglucosamine diphosphatase LpxG [Chlamydiales bacterium]
MSLFIDFLSIASVLGIWPRFIEPKMVSLTETIWNLGPGQSHLDNLSIVHISDLHFHKDLSQKFLDKVVRRICRKRPDLILFTGDLLCYGRLEEASRLKRFLERLEAPLGCYCTLGNHDYSRYVTLNREGKYDLLPPLNPIRGVLRGLAALILSSPTGKGVTDAVLSIPLHQELCALLSETPFQLLENATVTLPIGLNITGLGDMALGRCRPDTAFAGYNREYPGMILSHNPDSFPLLLPYPGDWILSGHTHGEQIHFPWPKWLNRISQKLARLENRGYTRGLFTVGDKKMYVNRGLGCHKPFRFCSIPEINVIRTKR